MDINLELKARIYEYANLLEHCNNFFREYINFHEFYTSDSKNRNKDNENTLHSKRERAIEGIDVIFNSIIELRNELKKELIKRKLLKQKSG